MLNNVNLVKNLMKKAMPNIASLPKWVMSEVGWVN